MELRYMWFARYTGVTQELRYTGLTQMSQRRIPAQASWGGARGSGKAEDLEETEEPEKPVEPKTPEEPGEPEPEEAEEPKEPLCCDCTATALRL